jgi:HNH endonuclease
MEEIIYQGQDITNQMTPIPGGFSSYLVHCPLGLLWSKKSNQFLLLNAKGTGDDSRYLMTSLTNDQGERHHFYLSEIVMSSFMGITKSQWKEMGLEVDHINQDSKNNSISNLRLTNSKGNKGNRGKMKDKTYLTLDNAQKVRDAFKEWTKGKVEFYAEMSKQFGVGKRTIQNAILGVTYKVIDEGE